MKKTHQFGLAQEAKAQDFLIKKGFSIISSRYKTKFGEIDIIAQKPDLIAFVEVKARKKSELIEVILREKQIARIKDSALFFLSQNPQFENYNFSFDLILINGGEGFQHFENYF